MIAAAVLAVAALLGAACQVRREPRPVGVGFLRVAAASRATDRAALSPAAWSPDGRRLAYGTQEGLWVHAVGDASGAKIAPGEAVTSVAWSASANVLAYVDRGALYTVRPDGSRRRRIPLPGVASAPVWAPGGDRLAVVVRGSGDVPSSHLWITSPTGALLRQVQWSPGPRTIATVSWYPDALHLFVGLAVPGGEEIAEWWRVRIAYPEFRKLPVPPAHVVDAAAAPAGGWIAYVATEGGGERAYVVRDDGSGLRAISGVERRVAGLGWAPRGDKVAVGIGLSDARLEVHVAATTGDGRLLAATYRPEFPDPSAGLSLVWSPDGARLAYGTNTGSTLGPIWIVRFEAR